jgi:hypothetical protein
MRNNKKKKSERALVGEDMVFGRICRLTNFEENLFNLPFSSNTLPFLCLKFFNDRDKYKLYISYGAGQ